MRIQLSLALVVSLLIALSMNMVGGWAYSFDQTGYKQSLGQAAVWTIENISNYTRTNISLGMFDSGKDGWSLSTSGGAWRPNENFTQITTGCKVGSGCINFTYNLSGTSGWRIINSNRTGHDATNTTGVGFWLKTNNPNKDNYLSLKLEITTNGVVQWENEMTTSSPQIYADSSDWKYVYIDFSTIRNTTNYSMSVEKSFLTNVSHVLIAIYNSTMNYQTGDIFIDNVEFVDFDEGGVYRNLYNLTTRNGRYQEGLYNLAYLYYNGLPPFIGNVTLLNYSVEMGDWLVRNQLSDGGWTEYDLNLKTSPAVIGFTGQSMFSAYRLIENEPIMQENITIYHQGNIINAKRADLWNDTFNRAADYVVNWSFPTPSISSWYSNQYLAQNHFLWMMYNYTGNETYIDTINSQLNVLSNSTQQVVSCFIPEANVSGSIGLDINYFGVSEFILYSFLFDSGLNTLKPIAQKFSDCEIDLAGRTRNYMATLANGSRGSTSTGGISQSNVFNATDTYNYIYAEEVARQKHYALTSFGDFSITTFTRGVQWDIWSAEHWNEQNWDSKRIDFRFPQNYTTYAYDLMTYSGLSRRNYSNSGTISDITQLEFPKMLFAWDNNNAFWVRGDNILTNTTNWIFSDENGNFTLPVTPKFRMNASTDTTYVVTQDNDIVVATTRVENVIMSPTYKRVNNNMGLTSVDLNITNLNLVSPYSDVRWGNGTIITRTSDTVTVTIPPGLYIEVGYFPSTASTATDIMNALVAFVIFMVFIFIAVSILTKVQDSMESDSNTANILIAVVIAGAIVLALIYVIPMLTNLTQTMAWVPP